MDSDQAAKALVQTARREVRFSVNNTMTYMRMGKPIEFEDPFTGRMAALPVDPDARVLADKLDASGLRKDAAFMDALERLLYTTAAGPVSGLFSAFDGEGAFAGDVQLDIFVRGGDRVASYLHEILFPIGEDPIESD